MLFWQCLFSPRLYRIYRYAPLDTLYEPKGLEKWGDKVISVAYNIMNIGIYASPFICMYIYKRSFFTYDEARNICRFFGGIGCLLLASFLMRAYGRSTNPNYVKFIQAVTRPKTDMKAYLNGIRQFDFDYYAWPATFIMTLGKRPSWLDQHPFTKTANPDLPLYQRVTIQVLAFVATHTFGLRLIYPGSMSILQTMLWMPLFIGRTRLVEQFDGERTKLKTSDGNLIDSMFVDNRENTPRGKVLVICCEGNSGFYEFGIMITPVKAGYSALGWNHPGFAESTGLPYPVQEHNAIDAVMQYAIVELGFKPEQIVTFGWSIGGYSAAWAAANYPVKGLVLDATFDDLLPLAQNHMPSSWSLLVKEVVRSYVDLNVARLLSKYDGPVHLVRRAEDEIICLRPGQISTNRGNDLLVKLIEQRNPEAVDTGENKEALTKLVRLQESQWRNQPEKTLVNLVSKYMSDLRTTHCTPLPEEHFTYIMDILNGQR